MFGEIRHIDQVKGLQFLRWSDQLVPRWSRGLPPLVPLGVSPSGCKLPALKPVDPVVDDLGLPQEAGGFEVLFDL